MGVMDALECLITRGSGDATSVRDVVVVPPQSPFSGSLQPREL